MSCTPDGDEIADPTMIQVGDIRYLRRAGGLPPLRPVLGIAHAQDPAFGFQSEPSTGLRQDPDTGTVYWRRNGVDLYSMDDGGSGGDVAVTSITPVASDRLLGRDTAGSGACEELTVGGGLEFTGSGGIQRSALTGDVTASAGSGSLTIASDAVTYAKMQNVSATDRLLGRSTAGAGDVEEIACTAAGRALLDDADAAAQRTTLGLAIGTDVQAYDAGLASLAALPTVADRLAYSTAADTWAETALTTFGRSLIDDADAAAGRDTLGASAGIWGLAVGGTAADLSATGGTGQFLRQSSAGAAITVGVIGHADLGSGGGSGSKYLRDDMTWQTVSAGVTDHGALTGLGDDDHTQYALLLGRSGGQTLIGGTAAGNTLVLQSTSHATRAYLQMNDPILLSGSTADPASTNRYIGTGATSDRIVISAPSGGSVRLVNAGASTPQLLVGSAGVAMGINGNPARALEVRSTSAQQRWSYNGTHSAEISVSSTGDVGLIITGDTISLGSSVGPVTNGVCIGAGQSLVSGSSGGVYIGQGLTNTGGTNTTIVGQGVTIGNASTAVGVGQGATVATSGIAVGQGASAGTSAIAVGQGASADHTSIVLGRAAASTTGNQFVAGSATVPITQSYLGQGVTAASPATTAINATGGSGTDIAGAGLDLCGGRGTGSGAGGSVRIRVSAAGASGTALRSLATVAEFGPATIGFYGVTPVARPSAYTQTYSTADRTLAAYTADNESVAYTGAADGEAQLADLNALRVAYENLRAFVEDLAQHHNSVVDDLQAVGLLQ